MGEVLLIDCSSKNDPFSDYRFIRLSDIRSMRLTMNDLKVQLLITMNYDQVRVTESEKIVNVPEIIVVSWESQIIRAVTKFSSLPFLEVKDMSQTLLKQLDEFKSKLKSAERPTDAGQSRSNDAPSGSDSIRSPKSASNEPKADSNSSL